MMDINKATIKINEQSRGEATFTIEPLVRGYGTTLGNALRRVLYAALPGEAIVGVEIKGVKHEFSTIEGVKEDVAEIILNLKEIAVKVHLEKFEKITARLFKNTPGPVRAKDIEFPTEVELMNGDLLICTLSEGASIDMDITVGRGKGYVSAQNNKKSNMPIGYIPIDSSFSPVKFVTYNVTDTRVAQTIDYDKLVISIKTDATSTPTKVISLAAQILAEHLKLFINLVDGMVDTPIFRDDEKPKVENEIKDIPIEQLGLSVRPLNCLKRHGINMVSELIGYTEDELNKIKNLGKKSAEEIIEKLKSADYSLKSKD
ncbi:MAG: DNA-directed RNA polymerase subunit alpha [Christensenellales bacterium]|nr:DNA-directed RNA polymerase subunit alpha [Clostridiales bacterium]